MAWSQSEEARDAKDAFYRELYAASSDSGEEASADVPCGSFACQTQGSLPAENEYTSEDEEDISTDAEAGPPKRRTILKSEKLRRVKSQNQRTGSQGGTGNGPTPCSSDDDHIPRRLSMVPSETDHQISASGGQPDIQESLEESPLFKDFVFFYIPNHKDKRPHVQRALEHGAEWATDAKDGRITHVVVSWGSNLDHVAESLGQSSVPEQIALVNDDYVFECLYSQRVLDPHQDRFRVEEAFEPSQKPEPLKELPPPKPTPAAHASESSGGLQLVRQLNVKAGAICSEGTKEEDDNASGGNALDAAISEASKTRDLPLDSDQGEFDDSSEDNESEDDRVAKRARLMQGRKGTKPGQARFTCMNKNEGQQLADSPNARTIEILQKMADYYDSVHDQWRTIGYRKAIASLRREPRKIKFREEAKVLPFVGERIAAKIEEIVRMNGLRRLENTNVEPTDRALQTFLGIYGVGFRQADKWVQQGHRTLDDIRAIYDKLTKNQQIGLDHYDDFQSRIPRAEVAEHEALVTSILAQVSPALRAVIGGSYRRGAPTCGDVDFIVTAAQTSLPILRNLILDDAIPRLWAAGYLQASLAVTRSDTGSKWHGAARLPGADQCPKWQRVDFLLVPEAEWGAALIYFTGNDVFNRSIRLLASKKGMRLNQRGLWKDVVRGPRRERVTQGSLLEARSEERIFELLRVPWRPPEHRVC